MKKIFSWIVLIVAAIAFVGCTKNGGTDEGSILGTWKVYRWVLLDGKSTQEADWSSMMRCFTFKENGEVVVSEDDNSEHDNYFIYFISGDQLTISNGSDSNTMTIRKLTKKELVLAYKDNEGDLNTYYCRRIR